MFGKEPARDPRAQRRLLLRSVGRRTPRPRHARLAMLQRCRLPSGDDQASAVRGRSGSRRSKEKEGGGAWRAWQTRSSDFFRHRFWNSREKKWPFVARGGGGLGRMERWGWGGVCTLFETLLLAQHAPSCPLLVIGRSHRTTRASEKRCDVLKWFSSSPPRKTTTTHKI